MKRTILIYFSFIVFCFSCDNRTALEIYKEELIIPEFEGIVDSTELWKGGGLVVSLKEKKETVGITNDNSILKEIKKGDFFKKLPNSNKCYIKRGDSIFYFDCVSLKRLDEKTKDSLREVKQWDRNKINHWVMYRISDVNR